MTFDHDFDYNSANPKPKTRVKLAIKLGVLAGIIWGLFLAAYYTMLPNVKFAVICATICFVVLVGFIFAWPLLVKAFKDAAEEGRLKRGDNPKIGERKQ